MIALPRRAAERRQRPGKFGCLDPFGSNLHLQRLGNAQNGAYDGNTVGIAQHIGDETPVDLQHVDRQHLQAGEVRKPRAKIIHRHLRVASLERVQRSASANGIADDHAFGQFQRQPVPGDAMRAQRIRHVLRHAIACHLYR